VPVLIKYSDNFTPQKDKYELSMKILAFIIIHFLIQTCSAEYVWTGSEWNWQEPGDPVISGGDQGSNSQTEGSADGDDEYYDDNEDYDGDYDGDYPDKNSQWPVEAHPDDEDNVEGCGDHHQYGSGGNVPVINNKEPPRPEVENPIKNYDIDSYSPAVYDDPEAEDDVIIDDGAPAVPTTETPTTTTTTTRKTKVPGSNNRSPIKSTSFFAQPGILAAVIGGAVVGLLCAILLVMFIVYRMRKKDEGSYALDEPKRSPNVNSYSKPPSREFYA